MSREMKYVIGCLASIVVLLFFSAVAVITAPGRTAIHNLWVGQINEIDNRTNYETKKKVEDTCRAMIASYEGDKLTWEQYKDSTKDTEYSWGAAAKIRANRTAVMYNEYILKNNYVWDGNVPNDIRSELPIIE